MMSCVGLYKAMTQTVAAIVAMDICMAEIVIGYFFFFLLSVYDSNT